MLTKLVIGMSYFCLTSSKSTYSTPFNNFRFLNHTLANLENDQDFNPFGLKHADAKLTGTVPGFTREQSLEWTKKVQSDFERVRNTEREQAVRRTSE